MKPALVIIPTYLTKEEDLEVTTTAIKSIRDTEVAKLEILCVDDGSPEPDLVQGLADRCAELESELHTKKENSGFSKTVNVGLERARDNGQDAVLLNADMEITTNGWLTRFRATRGEKKKAAVVGALLLFPTGLIQHAGIYFSLLTRSFDHRYKYGPGNLPEALRKEVCPVTGAFQFIRAETIETVGIYDDDFFMGWEDVDYCIRVFLAGEQCVYNPNVRGYHHEMLFRGRPSPKVADWQNKSFMRLMSKYQSQSFAGFVPYW